MPKKRLLIFVASFALMAQGCGGDDKKSATKSGAQKPADTALDADARVGVHDELVTCMQREDSLGQIVHYARGRVASDSEGVGGGTIDDRLSAPNAIGGLVEAKTVDYIGARADGRHKPGTPDVDVLIFSSPDEATAQAPALGKEAGVEAVQDGVFVTLVLKEAKAQFAEASAKALDGCLAEARP